MSFLNSFVPPDTPDYTRRTLRYDFLSGVAKGIASIAGSATAAVIAKKAFDANDFVIGVLYAAMHVGQISSPWIARFIRTRQAIPLIFRLEVASAAFVVLSAFMTDSLSFVLIISLAYVASAGLAPAFSRVYRQNYRTAMRGQMFALVRIGFNASTAVTGFVVGRLLDVRPDAYATIFPVLGVVGVVGALIFRRIEIHEEAAVPTPNPARSSGLRGYVEILAADRRYLLFLLIWAVFGFANMMMNPVRAIFITDERFNVNADYLQALLILLVIPQATVLLTLRFWGRLLDRYPVSFLRVWLQLFSGLDLLFYIFAPRIEWLYLASVLKGLQLAGAQVTWALGMMEFAPRTQVAEYTAIHTVFTGVRGLLAPFVAAYMLAVIGPTGSFAVGVGAIATSILLFLTFPYVTASWRTPDGAPAPRRNPFSRR